MEVTAALPMNAATGIPAVIVATPPADAPEHMADTVAVPAEGCVAPDAVPAPTAATTGVAGQICAAPDGGGAAAQPCGSADAHFEAACTDHSAGGAAVKLRLDPDVKLKLKHDPDAKVKLKPEPFSDGTPVFSHATPCTQP